MKNNKSDDFGNLIKYNDDSSKKSLLLGKG